MQQKQQNKHLVGELAPKFELNLNSTQRNDTKFSVLAYEQNSEPRVQILTCISHEAENFVVRNT